MQIFQTNSPRKTRSCLRLPCRRMNLICRSLQKAQSKRVLLLRCISKKTKDLALSEITEEGIENDNWSPEILKVFEMYMYLYPVWSGSMLKREGITRYTNVDVENWFGVVKNTILQKKKNINVGLFIRKLHIQTKGRTAELSLPICIRRRQQRKILKI